ncbi:MAG: hypothetical protein ABI855_17060, partial [Bacteroidota bacterium]
MDTNKTQKQNSFERTHLLLLIFFGVVSGCAFTLNILSAIYHHELSAAKLLEWLAGGSILFSVLFLITRQIILWLIFRSTLPGDVKDKFSKYHVFTYSVFLFLFLGAIGIKPDLLPIIIFLLFLKAQAVLIYLLMGRQHKEKIFQSVEWLAF